MGCNAELGPRPAAWVRSLSFETQHTTSKETVAETQRNEESPQSAKFCEMQSTYKI